MVEKIVVVAETIIIAAAERAIIAVITDIIAVVHTTLISKGEVVVMDVITVATQETRATIDDHISGGRITTRGTESGTPTTRDMLAQEAQAGIVDRRMNHEFCYEDVRR